MPDQVWKELDPAPLIQRLIEKSQAGKLRWEATADRRAFVVSVGGNLTFKTFLETEEDVGPAGQPEMVEIPVLSMIDEKGKTLWELYPRDVPDGYKRMWELYKTARRIGNKLDERVAAALQALEA